MFQCYFNLWLNVGNLLVSKWRQLAEDMSCVSSTSPFPLLKYYVILSYTLELCTFPESVEQRCVEPLDLIAFIRRDVVEM